MALRMDLFFEKAKAIAAQAAVKSQELAKEAAKLSQEIAVETAKRSKEIAIEASKKADEWKAMAGEMTPSSITAAVASTRGTAFIPAPQDTAELERYGVTAELREFVNGLTMKTFQDFPLQDSELAERDAMHGLNSPSQTATANIRQDLTEWQERHAVLVLKSVPGISSFRYILCPKHMKESRFWKIYFTLVKGYVAPYEEQASKQVNAASLLGDVTSAAAAKDEATNSSLTSTSVSNTLKVTEKAVTSSLDDQDLDAYLMGALGSSDEEPDDDGFDADFDQLVKSTGLDSDAEEDRDNIKNAGLSVNKNSITASDGSSDGELVEIPADLDTHVSTSEVGQS